MMFRQIATSVTLARCAIGFAAAAACSQYRLRLALAAFVLAAVLDKVDGILARRLAIVSTLGAFLDVLCDGLILLLYLRALLQNGFVSFPSFVLFLAAGFFSVSAQVVNMVAVQYLSGVAETPGRFSTALVYAACIIATAEAITPGFWQGHVHLNAAYLISAAALMSALFMLQFLLQVVSRVLSHDAPRDSRPEVYCPDPLARWLVHRFSSNPFLASTLYLAVFTMPLFLSCLAADVFFEKTRFVGLRWFYSDVVGYGVIVPIVVALSIGFYQAVVPPELCTPLRLWLGG